jgi:chromosome segregation ATPase
LKNSSLFKIILSFIFIINFTIQIFAKGDTYIIDKVKSKSKIFLEQMVSDFEQTKENYETIIGQLNKKNQELTSLVNKLNSQISEISNSNKLLLTENKLIPGMKQKLKLLSEQKDIMIKKIDSLQNNGIEKLTMLYESISGTLKAYKDTQIKLNDANLKITKLNELKQNMQNQLNDYMTKIIDFKSHLSDKDNKIQKLSYELDSIVSKNKELINSSTKSKELNLKNLRENKQLKEENLFLKKRIDELNLEQENYVLKNQKLIEDLKLNSSKFQNIDNQNKAQQIKINNLETQITKMSNDINDFKNKLDLVQSEKLLLSKKVKQKDIELTGIKKSLTESDTKIYSLMQNNSSLTKKYNELEVYKNLYNDVVKERNLQNAEIMELKSQKNSLVLKLEKMRSDSENLKSIISNKDEIIKDLKIQLNKLYKKVKGLLN